MTERETFFNNIRHPDNVLDDTPRLVFADFLQENGEADLAELIRVQVQLPHLGECARDFSMGLSCCCSFCDAGGFVLTRRERELLKAHPSWLRNLKIPCLGCEVETVNAGKVRRVPCDTCDGTGDLLRYIPGEGEVAAHGEPVEGSNSRNPTFTRGLTLSVECRLDEVLREGLNWQLESQWQPTPWALAYWRACVGLGRVPWFRVTDMLTAKWQSSGLYFLTSSPESIHLIKFLQYAGLPVAFPTTDSARHALEFALYQFCYNHIEE